MRENVRVFVELCAATLPVAGPIVELGALQVPGQETLANLRPLFPGREYVGCDMRPGPGVDRVEDAHALTFADASVGTVLSLDTLEHVARPQALVDEAWRVLRPGGLAIVSSVMDFPIHEYPSDYWRFTPAGLAELLRAFDARVWWGGNPWFPELVIGVGWKPPAGAWPDTLGASPAHGGFQWQRHVAGQPLHADPAVYPFAWLEDAYRMYRELREENRVLREELAALRAGQEA